jgi:hypothetical protein
MGRTIPSFRLARGEEEREWKVFRSIDYTESGIVTAGMRTFTE